ncbi:MAG: hypothetical protein OXU53_05455 [Deltaproteobacteria bacterium]|nr:hypothetical protein [Deltaproteobacteria bacterium]
MSNSTTEPQATIAPQASTALRYEKAKPLSLKSHPQFDEYWLQARIAEDPSLLGLGPLELIQRERRQPGAGRLDLLLRGADGKQFYEVEIQLGKSDEKHIIRTVEYWDNECKRYPQFEHTAVLVAEDITSRFLNVVSLFNGPIPIVAIQLNAIEINGVISLVFTKVLNQVTLGGIDDTIEEKSDRGHWENKASRATMQMVDQCLQIIREFSKNTDLNYTKFYIGLSRNGKIDNFAQLVPQRKDTLLRIKIEPSKDINAELDSGNMNYEELTDSRANLGYRYQIRFTSSEEINQNRGILKDLLAKAGDA